jgi:hypothetical protein
MSSYMHASPIQLIVKSKVSDLAVALTEVSTYEPARTPTADDSIIWDFDTHNIVYMSEQHTSM